MISTITVQNPHRGSSQSDVRYSRDSNLAGTPLPIIPQRTTRSHSLPSTHQSSQQRPFVSTRCYSSKSAIESDSGSSSDSEVPEAPQSITQTRTKRMKGVRHGILKLPATALPLSPQTSIDVGRVDRPHSGQGLSQGRTEENSPVIAAPRPLVYAPGMLRLSLETMRAHMLTDPHPPPPHNPRNVPFNGSRSAPPGSNTNEVFRPVVRKKSGQPVKSSLKASQAKLSVVTKGLFVKSEPPTPKVVHFDTQLEHVKLFLAEQKPLAVLRDGSPTEDTSGTDSDFPSFIYGDDDCTRRTRKKLVMRPINLVSKAIREANVALEDFYLNFDGSSILGKIRVRNIAFAKTVAIRFTFDSWQTISEVTARYAESIDPHFDRFSFGIRLNDLLPRIEGKTLMMAIRYNVEGQEYWDNNHNQDYVATFAKAKIPRENKALDHDDVIGAEKEKSRREQVISRTKDNNLQVCPRKTLTSQSTETEPPSLKSGIALGLRYDFATSIRNSNVGRPTDVPVWVHPPKATRSLSPPSRRSRTATVPIPSCSIPWPEKGFPEDNLTTLPVSSCSLKRRPPLASPRDFDEGRLCVTPGNGSAHCGDSADGASLPKPTRGRNHQRGYTETGSLGADSAVRRTPPGSPRSVSAELDPLFLSPMLSMSIPPSSFRYHSFPPVSASDSSRSSASLGSFSLDFTGKLKEISPLLSPRAASHDFRLGSTLSPGDSSGDSDLSTPSLSTPTSSRSVTPSPTDPFVKRALPPLSDDSFHLSNTLGTVYATQPVSPGTHYRHFLNKFCFFTGATPPAIEGASNAENVFPEGSPHDQPGTSGVVDDLASTRNDSGTPTTMVVAGKWGSRASTPVPVD